MDTNTLTAETQSTQRERRGFQISSFSRGGSGRVILYTLFMNKRAKKRLKEAIEKDRVERTITRQEPSPSAPRDLRNPKGFLPKPAKKRG
jgi:hypothetical protein